MGETLAFPTAYGGAVFRSRLEARWAGFFDLMGWAWQYEPTELPRAGHAGHVPDLWLEFPSGRLLVSIKPLGSIEALIGFGQDEIEQVETESDWILLGDTPVHLAKLTDESQILGVVSQRSPGYDWQPAWLGVCQNPTTLPHFSIQHTVMDFRCYSCGFNPARMNPFGAYRHPESMIQTLWQMTGNTTRWMPGRRAKNPFRDRLEGPKWGSDRHPTWDGW